MPRRMTDDLSKLEKKRWQEIAKREGLFRRTGISLLDVGSMGQLAKYIARPDVVIVKRHKTSEELPPDDVEVLTVGKYATVGWRWTLMTYSSVNGWLERDIDGDWSTTHMPFYWFSLDNFLEGVG